MSERPDRLVYVAGTGTEVGKTWWGVALVRELRTRGVTVAARKPVQSIAPGYPTDADALAEATGEPSEVICLPMRTYRRALAPPMAAAELGESAFSLADLVGETRWPYGTAVGVVEGAGGPRSPLADDGDNVDLARAIGADVVVVVSDSGLGAISAVRLSVDAFAPLPAVVALNRFEGGDALHRLNREWLVRRCGLDVVTEPRGLADRLAR